MGELIKVARLSEMPPGTCRHVDAGGQAVAVFNVDGTIYAIGGKCTHRGGPLGEGERNCRVSPTFQAVHFLCFTPVGTAGFEPATP